jgi:3-oxoacyl-[acyl-carrier protein] reductase
MRVALLSRTLGELVETVDLVTAAGGEAAGIVCDVSRSDDVVRARVESGKALGVATVVVNNAGVATRKKLLETSDEDWDAVMGVNLRGTFLVTRAFLPGMLAKKRGRVVNLASISATVGTAAQTAYNASKWGVVGFTKSLAEELRGTGVQAMSVLPGAVDTTMLAGSGFAAQMTPADVARTVIYAALDAPDAMNGSSIEVFGP